MAEKKNEMWGKERRGELKWGGRKVFHAEGAENKRVKSGSFVRFGRKSPPLQPRVGHPQVQLVVARLEQGKKRGAKSV